MKNAKKRWSCSYCCCIHSFQANFYEIEPKTEKSAGLAATPVAASPAHPLKKVVFAGFRPLFCYVRVLQPYQQTQVLHTPEKDEIHMIFASFFIKCGSRSHICGRKSCEYSEVCITDKSQKSLSFTLFSLDIP